MRCDHVASTLIRRHFDVCLLGWFTSGQLLRLHGCASLCWPSMCEYAMKSHFLMVWLKNEFHFGRLRGLDTLGRFSAIFYKEDYFYIFLYAFLYTTPLLKKGLLEKERNFPFRADSFSEGRQTYLTELPSPEK